MPSERGPQGEAVQRRPRRHDISGVVKVTETKVPLVFSRRGGGERKAELGAWRQSARSAPTATTEPRAGRGRPTLGHFKPSTQRPRPSTTLLACSIDSMPSIRLSLNSRCATFSNPTARKRAMSDSESYIHLCAWKSVLEV